MSRPIRLALTAVLTCTLSVNVAAQSLIIKGANLLDVMTGELVKDHVVLVNDGRIARISPTRSADLPAGVDVIDLQGHTLLPGLIDMHVHLTSGGGYHGYESLRLTDERRAILGVVHAETTLMAGFTTVRNVGAGSFGDVALRDAINDGDIPGPRMLVSGPPIGITGGHCSDNNLLPPEYGMTGEGVADGPWAARTAVRRNIKYGADLIKTCSTGGVMSKGTKVGAPQYTVEELTALVDEAHSRGLKVASHAHGAEGIINALIAGADTIEHASFIDDEGIALSIERGAALSMDIYVTEYILGEGASAGILSLGVGLADHGLPVGSSGGARWTQGAALRPKLHPRDPLVLWVLVAFPCDFPSGPHGELPHRLQRPPLSLVVPSLGVEHGTPPPLRLGVSLADPGFSTASALGDRIFCLTRAFADRSFCLALAFDPDATAYLKFL